MDYKPRRYSILVIFLYELDLENHGHNSYSWLCSYTCLKLLAMTNDL